MEECCVCYEEFTANQEPLPCGHWVHVECVQKSADALQDIRVADGYPPIKECLCPVCRQPVEGMVPKEPAQPEDIHVVLVLEEINTAFVRSQESGESLDKHIFDILQEKYPEHPQEILRASADLYYSMVQSGIIPLSQRDDRFSQIINRAWRQW